MVERLLKIDQVGMLIKNLQPIYKQHLRFIPLRNTITLRNVGMLVEEELAIEMLTKVISSWKNNYHNRDKKDNGSISEEVYALNHYIEYTLIETIYTQALERLLSMSKISLS